MMKDTMKIAKEMTDSLKSSSLPNEKPVFFQGKNLGSNAAVVTQKRMLEMMVSPQRPSLFQVPAKEAVDPFAGLQVEEEELV
jgi:hypothetical protein